MPLLELEGCSYAPWSQGRGLAPFSFGIEEGETAAVVSDTNEDAHLFLRALAGLERPLSGSFIHRGEALDASDYRRVLAYKRKVGYIASDAAVFSNRTLGETLLFHSRYFGEAGTGVLPGETLALCRHFEIAEKLDLRPAQAFEEDIRLTVIVRELAKKPDLLLVERPSTHLDHASHMQVLDHLRLLAGKGQTMVIYSFDRGLLNEIATQTVTIRNGQLLQTPGKPG